MLNREQDAKRFYTKKGPLHSGCEQYSTMNIDLVILVFHG
jgi:hypothetical protein